MQSTDQLEEATSEFGHNGQLTASGELDPKPKDASPCLEEPLAKLDCPTAEKDKPNKISRGGKKSTVKKYVRDSIMCCECKIMTSKPNYSRHVKDYHPNLVRCLYNNCAFYFKSVAERGQHLEQAHKNSRTFGRKRFCNSKVADNCPLLADKVASVVKCDVCKLTIRKDKLQSHLKMHQPKFKKCSIKQCDATFATKAEKQRHEEQLHDDIKIPSLDKGPKRCMFCMKWYAHKRLNAHITRQHKEAIKCDFGITCPKFFKSMSEKNEHFLKVHAAGRQELKCIYCSKMVLGKVLLRSHITRKHAEIRIRCKFAGCGQYFLSQVECDEHFCEKHMGNDGIFKWWHCSNCRFKSRRKWNLEAHFLRLHL